MTDAGDAPAAVPPPRTLRDLADALSAGVLLLDGAGLVRWANPAEDARWQDVLGRDFFRDLAPALEGEGVGPAFRAGMRAGRVSLEVETVLAGEAGTRFVRILLRDAAMGGQRWGVAVLEDRTELVAERERRKTAERDAAVGRRAAGLPHEVNNPLAAIRSFAQLLLRDARGPAEADALRAIAAGCDRIAALMDDLVGTLRRHGADDRGPVSLNTVVRRILALRGDALAALGVEVRPDLQEPLSDVLGERGALQQVVLELLLRAERDLGERGEGRLLVVRTREATRGVTLTVFDNGPGFSRDRLLRVFEPGSEGGAGVGLAVAAGIVRDHGGDIRAESEPGRNTTIVAHLPRAGEPRVPPAIAPAPEPPPEAPPVPGGEPSGAPRPLRILIADDEPTLRLALRRFLQRRGHVVFDAADADEAWALARREPLDAALVDARMPGDGLRLLERLESLPGLRGRTVLMTGDLGRARPDLGAQTGRPMLTKPFLLEEMAGLLEMLGNRAPDGA